MGNAIFLLHFLFVSNGCQPEKSGNGSPVAAGPAQCYIWSIGENMATARLSIEGTQVKGTLEYDYA